MSFLFALLAIHPHVQNRTLNVFAAASLKEAFSSIARRFEATRPGLAVRLNFAGSQTLAAQINQGAPADVFASAAAKNLQDVRYDVSTYRVFAFNRLEIALRPGYRAVRTVADLPRARNLVIADPAVPVGKYTEAFLSKGALVFGAPWLRSVRAHVVSKEADVKAVLAKVRLGEGDAGIVYVSDVVSAGGKVGEVAIPDSLNQVAEYPAAVPLSAANRADGVQFIRFLVQPEAQRILVQNGFGVGRRK